jgi:formate-dependent nitrite reductase membrane component NrfD
MKNALSQQGRLDFTVKPKLQTIWGFREAAVFALEGVSVTLFAGFMFLDVVAGMVVGIVLLITAVLLLLSHLGHPFRAWMAIRNFRRSWVSRGTVMIGAFIGLGSLYIGGPLVLDLALADWLVSTLELMLILAGFFILLYPGFAMAASPAIAFWSSGLLPVLSMVNGLASGGIVVLATYLTLHGQSDAQIGPLDASWLQQAGLALLALITLVYMATMRTSGTAASVSVAYLVKREPVLFWALTVGAGIVIPIAIIALTLNLHVAPLGLLWVGVAARLVGDVCGRYAWLKAGIYDAVLQPTRRV